MPYCLQGGGGGGGGGGGDTLFLRCVSRFEMINHENLINFCFQLWKYWLVNAQSLSIPCPLKHYPLSSHKHIITLTNPMYTITHSQRTHTHTHTNIDQKHVAPAALLSHFQRVHKTNLRILRRDPIFCSRSANQAKSVFPILKQPCRMMSQWVMHLTSHFHYPLRKKKNKYANRTKEICNSMCKNNLFLLHQLDVNAEHQHCAYTTS